MTEGRGPFQFKLWATLLTLAALITLVAMGSWQLERLRWKTALIAELDERGRGAAIGLPAAIEDPDGLEFRLARIEGRYLSSEPLFRGPTTVQRKVGYHIFLPFTLNDGRQMMVDLGFMPLSRADWAAELRANWQAVLAQWPLPEGSLRLEGILRRDGWSGSGWLKPANDPDKNVWHYVDLPAMAQQNGLSQPVAALYLVALNGWPSDGGLLRQRPGVDLRNDHLEYAITWYALAAILLTIYLIYHRRRKEAKQT